MSRKKLPGGKGERVIQIPVSEQQYAAISAAARSCGLNIPDYVRSRLPDNQEGMPIAPQLSPESPAAVAPPPYQFWLSDKRCDDCKRKGVSWAVCKETCKHKR